jgi:hypothetical protein
MGEAAKPVVIALALLATVAVAACGSESEGTISGAAIGPLKVVGGGAASYRHHDSVSTWGSETSKAKLANAAGVVHAYLVARAEGDWRKACSYVSEIAQQFLAARSERFAGLSCARALASVSKPIPAGSTYAATEVKADSFRASEPWAYLLYRAGGSRYFMPMVDDADGWKVNQLEPRPFVKPTSAKSGPG